MRNLKKVLSLALALVMLLGMMVMGAGAADPKFADVPNGSDNQEAIEVMNAISIIKGDEETGDFRPNDTLTRAEAAVIISKVLLTPSIVEKLGAATTRFTDVASYQGGWAASYVEACAVQQIILGDDDTHFAPEREVSGAEFAAMLLRVLGIDNGQFTNWPFDWQKAALQAGLDANGVNVFAEKLTRAQAAQMAFNALVYSPNGETTVYVVKNGAETLYSGSDPVVAALVKSLNAGSTMTTDTVSTGSIADKTYGLKKSSTTDAFGRPINVWTGKNAVKVNLNGSAVLTYTDSVKASEIYKDLGLASAVTVGGSATNANTFYVNGANYSLKEPGTPADKAIPHLGQTGSGDHNKAVSYDDHKIELRANNNQEIGDDSTTTEVYYDGTNVNIICYNTRPAQVKSVDEKKGEVTLTVFGIGDKTFKTKDLEKGQYVMVTMTNLADGCDTCREAGRKVLSATPATVIEDAKVTAYTSNDAGKGTVTVNGTTYKYSVSIPDEGGHAIPSYDMALQTYNFVLNENGYVCAVKQYAAADAAAPTNFALVLDAAASMTQGTLDAAATATLQVRAILGDGTVGVYTVAIGADKKAGGVTIINSAGTDFESGWETALKNKVYGYSIENGVMTLTALETALANEKVVSGSLTGYAGETSKAVTVNAASKTGLFTNNTVFVIYTGTGADTKLVKIATGLANLGNVAAMTGTVVMTGTSVADVGTVNVVFTQTAPTAASSGNYVYVDKDTKGAALVNSSVVNSYTGVTADGESITVYKADPALAESGVYNYNSDNTLGAAESSSETGTAVVIGSLIKVETANYYNITDATQTVHVDGKTGDVKDGDNVIIILDGTNVETIYILPKVGD